MFNSPVAKAGVASVGAILNIIVVVLQASVQFLPPQWAAAVIAIISLLTALGVYQVPNRPAASPPGSPPATPWPTA